MQSVLALLNQCLVGCKLLFDAGENCLSKFLLMIGVFKQLLFRRVRDKGGLYVPSNGICRGFAFKYGKFLLPPRFLTALSVPKVPTREQLRLYNARKKCKANKFASSRQMWYITYSDEICLFLEKRRENKTYEENKI